MEPPDPESGPLLFPQVEVAELFGVDAKTVGRWASRGLFRIRRLVGGGVFCQAEVPALHAPAREVRASTVPDPVGSTSGLPASPLPPIRSGRVAAVTARGCRVASRRATAP